MSKGNEEDEDGVNKLISKLSIKSAVWPYSSIKARESGVPLRDEIDKQISTYVKEFKQNAVT